MHKSFYNKSIYLSNIKYNRTLSTKNNNPINNIELTNMKHFTPTIREWNNSVYNFDKRNSNSSPVKYNQLDKLIKNYFNLSNQITIARSKRMRYLRRKATSKKMFLSKPEIKQNNDKIIITIYSYDRNKQVMIRRLFYYNRPTLINKITNLKRRSRSIKRNLKGYSSKSHLMKKNITYLLRKLNNKTEKNRIFSSIKFSKEIKLLKEKNKLNNKNLKDAILFAFFKNILSLFDIQIVTPIFSSFYLSNKDNKILRFSNRKFKNINNKMFLNVIESKPEILYWINYNTLSIERINKDSININILREKFVNERKILNKLNNFNHLKLFNFKSEINNKLWSLIHKQLIKNNMSNTILSTLFNNLYIKLRKFAIMQVYKTWSKRILKYVKFTGHNILKIKMLLPVLKNTIDNLYNKKVELNIVDLKYFHLNSDIFTQVLISKLQKKISVLKIFKQALIKLNVTAPERISDNKIFKINEFNNLGFLNLNSNLNLNYISHNIDNKLDKDSLSIIFDAIYPKKFTLNKTNKIANVLKGIKYKSLWGILIKATGRLTRRNTASRSALYVSHRGNLRNNDQYLYLNKIYNIPNIMLRNDIKSNIEYTSKGSFRRIGSFGIKTWISNK